MKRIAIVVSFVLLLASLAMASDLTGKWSGSFLISGSDGETKESTVFMDLKQNGTELTGTAGPGAEKQWAILKGKVEGSKITFEVQSDEVLIKFEIALVDGHLKGGANAEREGKTMKAVLELQRATN